MYIFLEFHGLCLNLAEICQECSKVGPTEIGKASVNSSSMLRWDLNYPLWIPHIAIAADLIKIPCVFRAKVKTIVIFMNEEDANGREGTKVPLIAHVHSKELLFSLYSQPNVSGMR